MDNQAWARTEAEFEQRRQQNEQEENRRREEISRKMPALDQLIEERHNMILRSVRGAFTDPAMRDAEAMMERCAFGLFAEMKGIFMKTPSDSPAPVS